MNLSLSDRMLLSSLLGVSVIPLKWLTVFFCYDFVLPIVVGLYAIFCFNIIQMCSKGEKPHYIFSIIIFMTSLLFSLIMAHCLETLCELVVWLVLIYSHGLTLPLNNFMDLSQILNPAPVDSNTAASTSQVVPLIPVIDPSTFRTLGLTLKAKCEHLASTMSVPANCQIRVTMKELDISRGDPVFNKLVEAFPPEPSRTGGIGNALATKEYRVYAIWSSGTRSRSVGSSIVDNLCNRP